MKKLLIISLLIIAACAAPAPEPQACCEAMTASCLACSEGVSVEQYCADNPETAGCMDEPIPEVVPVPEPELLFDGATKDLQAKGITSTNYKFSYAALPENKAQRTYYVRGDFVRIELYKPQLREDNSYDIVYLDLVEQKAAAYCELGNPSVCPTPEKLVSRPDYNEYYVELPHELIGRLTNGELVSSITYDNSVSDIVKTYIDGSYARITVNRFYGIPAKVEIYPDDTYSGEPAGQQNRDFAFNVVSEEQVTPLDGW